MAGINLDGVEPHLAHSPYRVPAGRWSGTAHRRRGDVDPAMIFAATLLLAASLVRLVPPLSGREAFGAEPTLALCATVACAWIALREALFRLLDYRAALGARARRRRASALEREARAS